MKALVILIGLAITFIIAATVGLAIHKANKAYDSGNGKVAKKTLAAIAFRSLAAIACLIGTLVFSGMICTIATGTAGVQMRLGKVLGKLEPGLHIIAPFTDRVILIDTKVQQLDGKLQAYSKDAQTVDIEVTVQYRVTDPIAVVTSYGDVSQLDNRMYTIVFENAKRVFADKSDQSIIEKRSQLSAEVKSNMIDAFSEFPLIITDVALADVSFSTAFEHAVEQKMTAEQTKLQADIDRQTEVIKAQQRAEVAEKDADAAVAKAKGEADAKVQMADAEAKAKILMAEAEASSRVKIAEGESEALGKIAATWGSLSVDVREVILRNAYIEQWNGALPKVTASDSPNLFIGAGEFLTE